MFKTVIRALAWLTLLVILAATLAPLDERPHLGSGPTFERAGAFALLGVLFCVGYRRFWPLALFVVIIAAGGFELAQALTSDRHAMLADALVKTAGGLVGVAAGLLYRQSDRNG